MSQYRLAQLNIARMKAPLESPLLADFVANLERVNALAEAIHKLEWLRRHGPTADASGFRQPFAAPDAGSGAAGAFLDQCPAT